MPIKQISTDIRVRVTKGSMVGSLTITLRLQAKVKWHVFTIWTTKKKLLIELKNYWGWIPGDRIFGGCLKQTFRYGQELEVWPPSIFNLDNRIAAMAAEYISQRAHEIEAQNSLVEQLGKI